MWKKSVVAQFEETFQNLSGRFKEHPRQVDSTAEVKTDYLLNTNQKLYPAILCARLLFVRESVPLPF
jgi:hypothetical protein